MTAQVDVSTRCQKKNFPRPTVATTTEETRFIAA